MRPAAGDDRAVPLHIHTGDWSTSGWRAANIRRWGRPGDRIGSRRHPANSTAGSTVARGRTDPTGAERRLFSPAGHRCGRRRSRPRGMATPVVLVLSGTDDPLAPGTGHATIRWTSVSGNGEPPQPFGGTIDGLPVSGLAVVDSWASGAPWWRRATASSFVHIFEYTGTFDGEQFRLGLSFQLSFPAGPSRPPTTQVARVQGTYGHRAVNVVLVAPVSAPKSVSFHGTIGEVRVSGTFTRPTRNGATNTATATFTVTG